VQQKKIGLKRMKKGKIISTDKKTKLKFSCKICGKSFKRKYDMSKHAENHGNNYSFECQICSKKIKRKHHVKDHMMTHSTEKNCICSICGAAFKTNCSLRQHYRVKHNIKKRSN
jgi:uncharacterized Zn-finger protein